jgi:methyl-accepting chemotaxis protein WspA
VARACCHSQAYQNRPECDEAHRRLAEGQRQTAVATLDTESMVRLVQGAVPAGVMQTDQFGEEVRSGVGRVAEANGQTGQIISEVAALSERFGAVNEGMSSQSAGARQVNEAMGSIAANVREASAALEELNKATHHLRASVEQLNQEIASSKVWGAVPALTFQVGREALALGARRVREAVPRVRP